MDNRHLYVQSAKGRLGDLTGAFGDLGTFLPLMAAILATGAFAASPLLLGFGLFAIATGLFYRLPVPVQPMKAVAAAMILGELDAGGVAAAGLILGVILILLSASGLIARLGRIVPLSVLLGIQLGLGLSLLAGAVKMASTPVSIALVVLVALVLIAATLYKWGPVLVGISALAGIVFVGMTTPLPPFEPRFLMPDMLLPDVDAFTVAASGVVFPQLALTLTNAVILVAFVAADHFPKACIQATPARLAGFTGVFNIALAPFGAMPMCHGAGGLPAQYRLGARTGLATVVFGLSCVAFAFFTGNNAASWLAIVPLEVIAGLLAFAGYQLANVPKLLKVRSDCYLVVALVAVCCLLVNPAVGLAAGIVAEYIRNTLSLRRVGQ